MDTTDPNELRNYSKDGEIPPQEAIPATDKRHSHSNDLHPCLAVLQRYLKRFTQIERWTIMEDVILQTVEFRITLGKKVSEDTSSQQSRK